MIRMKTWAPIMIAVASLIFALVRHNQAPLAAMRSITVELGPPMGDAMGRITKKPFGLYVSPRNSPVSPERFTGYHSGVDFETTPSEKDSDVPVLAVCTGPIRQKSTATGYGGVVVQDCTLGGAPITVVYGHVRLMSVIALAGQQVKAGQQIALLGDGFSSETDGERKHLHLGIHSGSMVSIRGYVQTQTELSSWIDIRQYLQ